ncbi:NUDIX hydrolase [Umboniibacter marinipuniceus]|uniref:ADP-ribose pyrophosphatase YjhB (NUDIX family) n=1 Tax=Umboniibacter marinipuniceus TaxID=569599 RepID=A0A3M0AC01_9GAMM|nr:NUDIX domain-containing protein [Umboniibacter marinipuniceus]RMA82693.1 ADP-ribose pyrophosphatase YjhB (NUDIX family) [Umboniibacter marinipuniceus]
MNEREFLKQYDKTAFDQPIFSVDNVVFTVANGGLEVLLVQRAEHPFKGHWGLPGGFVDLQKDLTLDDTALRKIREKAGVEPDYIEQLETLGSSQRDPRDWSITTVFTALISKQRCVPTDENVSSANWFPVTTLSELQLAFDHLEIIERALKRLKNRATYSLVPCALLGETFTLAELQHVHELILGKKLEAKAFRRRVENSEQFEETGGMTSGRGRPAAYYRLRPGAMGFEFVRSV